MKVSQIEETIHTHIVLPTYEREPDVARIAKSPLITRWLQLVDSGVRL